MLKDPLNDALRFLKFRLRSRHELEEHLLSKGYQWNEIHSVLIKLEEKRLIDDHRFTSVYISDGLNVHYKGPFRLKVELLKLGISEEKIEEAMNEELLECDLKDIIRRAIGNTQIEDVEKIKRKLFRKGFSIDSINEVLKEKL
jgi:regulatory protein